MTDEERALVIGLLMDIRDGVWALAAPPVEHDECLHPDDQRVDLSTLSDRDHWICRACRFEHATPERTMN
jgi:hypothetical protein